MSKNKCKNCKLSDEDCSFGCDKENLFPCINGVYEGIEESCDRYYIVKKTHRNNYKALYNIAGTNVVFDTLVSSKFLKDCCKYVGQARATWEDLFEV